MNFNPKQHDYVEHRTYTGPDCAICGRPLAEHCSAIVVKEMTREEAEKRYPAFGTHIREGIEIIKDWSGR